MKKCTTSLLFILSNVICFGQFAGPPGTSGSTAMHRDSSAFVNWASMAHLELGLVDITNEFSGYAASGNEYSPTGFPDGNCVSLGDSGVVTLTFPQPITNLPGPDFAVFENGFSNQFLELAFVEVSSDGVNFTRFPAISNVQTDVQIGPFDAVGDGTLLYNLAGKYRANFGTPFDLEELDGTPGLDISDITHVRIIDVIGIINGIHRQFDSQGNVINDPHPTAFPQCGFDLDAVGVIHQGLLEIDNLTNFDYTIYPNPAQSGGSISIATSTEIEEMRLISLTGERIATSNSKAIELENCPSGIYLLEIQSADFMRAVKVVVR